MPNFISIEPIENGYLVYFPKYGNPDDVGKEFAATVEDAVCVVRRELKNIREMVYPGSDTLPVLLKDTVDPKPFHNQPMNNNV